MSNEELRKEWIRSQNDKNKKLKKDHIHERTPWTYPKKIFKFNIEKRKKYEL